MRYRDFGRTGWQVSTIGLGTWNIGNQWGALDDKTAWATVRAAYDHGMNLFDAAESYGVPNGLSEERLGVAMAGFRHNVYVVSKIGNWGARAGAPSGSRPRAWSRAPSAEIPSSARAADTRHPVFIDT